MKTFKIACFIFQTFWLFQGAVAFAQETTHSQWETPTASSPSLQYRIALLGNPTSYPDYTEERMAALAEAGFNAIQLNIAWLSRPNDEALNLNDVVTKPGDVESTRTAERRAQLLERNRLAKKAGLRTIFHFGSPFMWRNPETGEIKRQASEAYNSDPSWFDIQNPKVVAHEVALLKEFRKQFPDVDDILVYTYDQDAWQTSEWTQSKLTRGVPLHARLPKYLTALRDAWMEGRPADDSDHIIWWEPWELSAGQVYKCLPQLPKKNFGMMLHTNIAEVQIARPIDVWFRNTARMSKQLGIPVVGEGFFGSATEEIQPLSFPCPRLTDEQLKAMLSVDGLCGVKEYFGVVPLIGDLNLAMFTARIKSDGAEVTTAQLLDQITEAFGAQQAEVLKLLEALAEAVQMFPWDVSWYARLSGTGSIDHGWSAAFIRGQQVETPSWESTRRSLFMMTEDQQPHPFLIEDVQLRCELTIEHLDDALSISRTLVPQIKDPVYKVMLKKAMADVEKWRRVVKSYALHLRETNVAMLLRTDLETSQPMTAHLLDEMAELLKQDVANQDGKGRVVEMQKEFEANPENFVRTRLVPTKEAPRERGVFTLTTR